MIELPPRTRGLEVRIQGMHEIIRDLRRLDDRGKSILNDVALSGAQFAAPQLANTIPPSDDDKHIKDKVKAKSNKRKSKYTAAASVTIGSAAKGYNYAFHYETGYKMTLKDGSIKRVPPAKTVRRKFDQIKRQIADHMGNEFVQRVGGI